MGDSPANPNVVTLPPPPVPTENEKRAMAAQAMAMGRSPYETQKLFSAPIEEQAAGTLVDAVALVARAVTAKIAYHQAQIDALRRALKPFNEMSSHGDGVGPVGADDAVKQLLEIAHTLKAGGG